MVKVQLHSAGAASLLHPNAAAALGTPGLAALLLVQILPVLHPTVHNTHGGDPAVRSSRRSAGAPTARIVRREVEEGASPPGATLDFHHELLDVSASSRVEAERFSQLR